MIWPKWSANRWILSSSQMSFTACASGRDYRASSPRSCARRGLRRRPREETTVLGAPRSQHEQRMHPAAVKEAVESSGLRLVRVVEVSPYPAVFKKLGGATG
jgi:hypothetical protein